MSFRTKRGIFRNLNEFMFELKHKDFSTKLRSDKNDKNIKTEQLFGFFYYLVLLTKTNYYERRSHSNL